MAENRRRALAAAGADPARAASLRQRHGSVVVEAGAVAPARTSTPATTWPEGDALVTSQPGLPLVAHGADCLTAALVAPGGARVGVVHAGWRGLVAGVLEAAAERVGPGFVGRRRAGGGGVLLRGRRGRRRRRCARASATTSSRDGRADLAACAGRALERAAPARSRPRGLCTICDAERFHSHRRDGAPAAAARP